ncbi:hypothetical protein BU24DRAFT_477416 [Aaosphaeria arxii CBS 175.79]|uniref:HNH nuclease domain-containing protein n=1 Tax=Aaosphaeria arxii CBS 175.79 TaxID=1450172 RepID=A0A6A5Y641_9PLEO|nr:uncharacterized protein BU24DRAFT_477416 [Aaosphaeria arxii CBS 175.79]KAF2020250.1 hypothetical protein BU24DRAFT_477416 [Aaosphaeria arxii CBS 175.79]
MSLIRDNETETETTIEPKLSRDPIRICHPDYEPPLDVLLMFNTPDSQDTEGIQKGVNAQVVFDACNIVAGNPATSWLSISRSSSSDNAIKLDTVLIGEQYFFHVLNDSGKPYKIVPTFQEWRYPHGRLPTHWAQAVSDTSRNTISTITNDIGATLQNRDLRCRITNRYEGTNISYIVPQRENAWWKRNSMLRYNNNDISRNTSNNLANTMLLRSDLHAAFDASKFVIVPKQSKDKNWWFAVHVTNGSSEHEYYIHNRALKTPHPRVESLYARFAWSVFTYLAPFLTAGKPRMLSVSTSEENGSATEGFVTAKECERYVQSSLGALHDCRARWTEKKAA